MKRFTLIELLVVISIIGVLASLLLPVLSKARAKSRQAVCTSNLKQIGLVASLYPDDNAEYFPAKRHNVAGAESQQINWLGKTGTQAYAKRADTVASQRFLNPYIKANVTDSDDIEIAQCPTAFGERQYDRAGSSYGGNNMRPNQGVATSLGIDKNPATNGVIQINQVNKASRMVYFFELPTVTVLEGNGGDTAVFHYEPYDFRFQLAFVDGHVSSGVRVNTGLYSTDAYTFDDDF
jgi:prepilin-type N-terminal cleavage/methylation domain-containing protein/prepilin-type processing-associated H-X9-DG protein